MKRKSAVVTLLALATVLIVYVAWRRNGFFDAKVYYGAIRYWFHGDGGLVYDWMRPNTPYGFTYPPFAGLVMAPMAVLPFSLVLVVGVVATVATTCLVTWWLARPVTWFPLAVACCLAISFEPVRETITFGQVNVLLLALVAGDLLVGLAGGRRWAGVGVGLATAVKLTPAIFLGYLLITRRWRAAAVAAGTAAGATLLAALVFPDETREFWTSALWDTNRIGALDYLSNQSERGLAARLDLGTAAWIAGVVGTLAVWVWRVGRHPDDILGGLALTGVVGCLISPVTWIHHGVWLLPAIVRCVQAGRGPRRLGVAAYLAMTSHLTWLWEKHPERPLAPIGANLYVWFSLALLIWTPMGGTRSPSVNELDSVGA